MRCAIVFLIVLSPLAGRAAEEKVVVDNAWARATRIVLAPHEKLPAREYAESIDVYLSDTGSHKDGDTAHFDAGHRTEENATEHPVEEVIVELKPNAPGFPPHSVARDPVKLAPKYHSVDFENARVRVLRTILDPHIKSPLHDHPSYVVVYLTELHTTMAIKDGKTIDNVRHKGDVAWRDALSHVTENIGDRRAMEIQVELK